ncbi:RNA-directed DNA polymerase, eukaryota, reverse transcriptase zinc-binding domain protein [Tanacetum coccineum]
MDKVTTQMCNDGIGRLGYARVLVEVNAKDDLKDRIKVCYKDKNKVTIRTKFVGVEYAWKPLKCSHCAVFGHEHSKCEFNPKRMKEKDNQTQADSKKEKIADKEGFVQEKYNKLNKNRGNENMGEMIQNEKSGYQTPNREKEWKVTKDVIDAIRKSANKYSVLEDQNDNKTLRGITLDEKGGNKEDEILDNENEMANNVVSDNMVTWNVRGMCNRKKQKEIKRVIQDENPNAFALIIVGWNPNEMNMMLIHTSDQTMLYMVENICKKTRFYCCFTYDANAGKDRRSLWKTLRVYKNIVNGNSWILIGYWNVSLNVIEHSARGSCKTADMLDFQECLEDIKIDRVLGNARFVGAFPNSYAVFLPYLTLDNCPAMLIISNALKKQKRAFRFANFVTDKPEFLKSFKDNWEIPVKGCDMFKLAKRTKNMKFHMKNLAWKKEKLKKEANILKEYCEAVSDEEKLLFQQAKIDWLKDRDINSKFFHAFLKCRRNKSIIYMVQNELGESFYDDKTISQTNSDWMIRQVTNEEINQAMFDIDDNKASGPDRFSSRFYKQSWEVIRKDACPAVKEFFNKGKILGKLRQHISKQIGDGKSSFMWHDKWWDKGVICDIIPMEEPNSLDTTLWTTKKGVEGKFSTNKAGNDIMDDKETVKWWNLVWYTHCIPRHAFVLWLAIQGRLTTQDRLIKWYPGSEVVLSIL